MSIRCLLFLCTEFKVLMLMRAGVLISGGGELLIEGTGCLSTASFLRSSAVCTPDCYDRLSSITNLLGGVIFHIQI